MNTVQIAQTVASVSPRINPWNLIGPSNKKARAAIIQSITGIKPKSNECGITAMEQLLFNVFPVPSFTCLSHRYEQIENQIRQLLHLPTTGEQWRLDQIAWLSKRLQWANESNNQANINELTTELNQLQTA